MVCDADVNGHAVASHRLLLKEVVTTSKMSSEFFFKVNLPECLLMSGAFQMRRGAC